MRRRTAQTAPKRVARASDGAARAASHVPVRQCVACRARAEKRKMLRFVRDTEGQWVADRAARRPGRGAYLCSAECAQTVRKNKRYKGLAAAPVASDAWPATERE